MPVYYTKVDSVKPVVKGSAEKRGFYFERKVNFPIKGCLNYQRRAITQIVNANHLCNHAIRTTFRYPAYFLPRLR